MDDLYHSVLLQEVPAGAVVVLATVNIGAGPPPEIPDVTGALRCRLSLEVPTAEARDVVVSVGPHPHCASPPVPAPAEVASLRRVSVQPSPESGDSCLSWWTVDLFLTPEGEVAAVTLDIWEP